MKNLIFVFAALIIASCTSVKNTKVVITPAGNWDYVITGTPEGDFMGVMSIVSDTKIYSAKINAKGSEISFYKFTWDEPTSKVGGDFVYSGTSVFFEATLNGEEMTGSMSAEGMNFPFKATRKK